MILLLPISSAYPPSVHHHDWLSSILINGKQKDFFFHIYKFWKIFYKSCHSVINVPPRSYPWRPLSNGNRLQFSWRSNKNPIQLCGVLQHSFLFPFILSYNFQLHLASAQCSAFKWAMWGHSAWGSLPCWRSLQIPSWQNSSAWKTHHNSLHCPWEVAVLFCWLSDCRR